MNYLISRNVHILYCNVLLELMSTSFFKSMSILNHAGGTKSERSYFRTQSSSEAGEDDKFKTVPTMERFHCLIM